MWRPAQISLIVCQNKYCCHPMFVTSVVYDHYLIVFRLEKYFILELVFSSPKWTLNQLDVNVFQQLCGASGRSD